jgi:excisionase family DNA binding protein
VEEFGRIIGIGRNSAYQAVERGDVRAVRLGKRILIPKTEVPRILAGEPRPAARVA